MSHHAWVHLASQSTWARSHQVGATHPQSDELLTRQQPGAPSLHSNASHREGSTVTEQIGMPLQTQETHPEHRSENMQTEGKVPSSREDRSKSREQVGMPQSMMGISHSRGNSPQSRSPNSQTPGTSLELQE